MVSRLFRLLAILAMVSFSYVAVAQVSLPSGAQPGRERDQFAIPPSPQAQPRGPGISLPSTVAPEGATGTKLVVRKIVVVGSTIYSTEQLAPLYEELIGREVPLQAIYDLAQRITAKYGADGYVLSRAIVPPQELNERGAVVKLRVVEGFVDKVEWPREKLAKYRDFFSHYTARIIAERPVNVRTIERYLLLANDLPGLKFSTTLKASKRETGGATLVVEVTEKPIEVNARIDNRGTKSRGPLQFLVSPTINNIFGQHAAFTMAYAGASPLSELQYIAPGWRHVLTAEGLTAFVNASYAWGYPGVALPEQFKLRTRSTYIESGASYPVIRERERNFTLVAMTFMSDNYSFLGIDANQWDRLRGIRIRADADFASQGGVSQFSLTYSEGFVGFGSPPTTARLSPRPTGGSISRRSRASTAGRSRCLIAYRLLLPRMRSTPLHRCSFPSSAPLAAGCLGGHSILRTCWGITAGWPLLSCATTCRRPQVRRGQMSRYRTSSGTGSPTKDVRI